LQIEHHHFWELVKERLLKKYSSTKGCVHGDEGQLAALTTGNFDHLMSSMLLCLSYPSSPDLLLLGINEK
jgi:hypothetical protein